LTRGSWILAQQGQIPFLSGAAIRQPWWWTWVASLEHRIQGIRETAGLDKDGLEPPKELWFSGKHEELKSWLDERRELLKPLDDRY